MEERPKHGGLLMILSGVPRLTLHHGEISTAIIIMSRCGITRPPERLSPALSVEMRPLKISLGKPTETAESYFYKSLIISPMALSRSLSHAAAAARCLA